MFSNFENWLQLLFYQGILNGLGCGYWMYGFRYGMDMVGDIKNGWIWKTFLPQLRTSQPFLLPLKVITVAPS